MKLYKRLIAGLITAAALNCGLGCESSAEETFKQKEESVRKTIAETSPFIQTPITAPLPDKRKESKWYDNFVYIPINSNDIAYVKESDLYISKNKDEKQSQKIADNIRLYERHIFAFGKDKDNLDVYWIDNDDKHNLKKLENNKGTFGNQEKLCPLKDYFRVIPEHIELGDVNADGQVDIIYGGTVDVTWWAKTNSINILIGNGNKFEDKGAVYYLGNDNLEGLIARDVDGDGDSDVIYKLTRNDKELYGLENKTKKGDNPAVFQDGFRDKVENNDAVIFIGYWYLFGPGRTILFSH
jgi:hypothetical protein